MGNKKTKPETTQAYHGAFGPLQYTLGVDRVLDNWIRSCGWLLDEIPKDIFRFVLRYTSFFDDFQFQDHHLWITKHGKDWCSACKNIGGGIHNNALFGSVLTGDIEYRCKVVMRNLTRRNRELLSVGLVEPDFYEYAGQHMHKGKGRCVFMYNRYYDCKGEEKQYDSEFEYRLRNTYITLLITVNMKDRNFSITDTHGHTETIHDIPDERVLCFEIWPVSEVQVSKQTIKWV